MRISGLVVGFFWGWLAACGGVAYAEPEKSAKGSLKPFATDGCSRWFDGTASHPYLWRHCCVAHDKAYWLGGSVAQRKLADEALKACVAQVGSKAMGNYIYMNVRWAGAPLWLMPYRWGYGWDYWDDGRPRGYKMPNALELEVIAQQLPAAERVVAEDALKHPTASTCE